MYLPEVSIFKNSLSSAVEGVFTWWEYVVYYDRYQDHMSYIVNDSLLANQVALLGRGGCDRLLAHATFYRIPSVPQ